MAAVSRDISAALVALLNGASLSQSFTAIRRKRPGYDQKDLENLQVIVTGRGCEVTNANRTKAHHDYLTEIAIVKLLDSPENTATDPMDDLVEEIADTIRNTKLATTADTSYLRLAYESLTDETELENNDVFFALVSVMHRATR